MSSMTWSANMGDAGSRVKGLAVMVEVKSPESEMGHESQPLSDG